MEAQNLKPVEKKMKEKNSDSKKEEKNAEIETGLS